MSKSQYFPQIAKATSEAAEALGYMGGVRGAHPECVPQIFCALLIASALDRNTNSVREVASATRAQTAALQKLIRATLRGGDLDPDAPEDDDPLGLTDAAPAAAPPAPNFERVVVRNGRTVRGEPEAQV